MAIIRTATTTWEGNLSSGEGRVNLDTSEQGTFDVTWKARAEEADYKTSPEELIAAAHSSCFSMALSHALGEAGYTAEEIRTSASVSFVPGEGIKGSELSLSARIPGIEDEEFQRLAQGAKDGCPVSLALAGIEITLKAELIQA
ncbi:OsmC family peroxiredoxin [Falsarthrobacter nasiphocae]|uniref:Osmotically inducible protein OsmC n=1 Tax=Falsarthrobacter nasiphocae TaxID=189863 RepID=A0AAE3YEL6_9MICC|nr:OsmC family peroxiredoxin [Falsarthrobacter nasiphocae]MDR6891287.1 osmotically inducible protein OsmC [Falsarthrobacter nasiphocae]